MKTNNTFIFFLLSILFCATFVACSDDDHEEVAPNSLSGYWHCTNQKWIEDGETEQRTYTDNDPYYICFEDDFTGYMNSGNDQLLELMGYYSFTWSVSGNKIKVKLKNDWYDTWQIKAITDDTLELCWKDEELSITCRFKKIR